MSIYLCVYLSTYLKICTHIYIYNISMPIYVYVQKDVQSDISVARCKSPWMFAV